MKFARDMLPKPSAKPPRLDEESQDSIALLPLEQLSNDEEDLFVTALVSSREALETLRANPRVAKHFRQFCQRLRSDIDAISPELKSLRAQVGTDNVHKLSYDECVRILALSLSALGEHRNYGLFDIAKDIEKLDFMADGETNRICQLIFVLLGYFNNFYAPNAKAFVGNLELKSPGNVVNDDLWSSNVLPLAQAVGSYTDVIRQCTNTGRPFPMVIRDPGVPHASIVDTLKAMNLDYYILEKLGEIRIVWVDSLLSHLKFDRRNKVLMLFRRPTTCALMNYTAARKTSLDSLLLDYLKEENLPKSDERYMGSASNLYREVLLTYRLLFGQQRHAWGLARTNMRKKRLPFNIDQADELVKQLCTHSWIDEILYDDIKAPTAKTVYSAKADFPFFGDRLSELHQYVELLSPNDWRTLWYDRRDIARFWTVWAVIIFGVIATLLAAIGLGLAAAQVAGSFRPS